MAAALVSVGTRSSATTGTSVAPALPASMAAGDLMVAAISIKNNATISTPSGWTKLQQTNNGTLFTAAVYWRLWQSGDAAPSFSWTGSVNNQAQIIRITGANTVTPLGTIGAVATGSANPHTSTGFNSTANNSLIVLIDMAAGGVVLAAPTGWTQVQGGTGNTAALTYAYELLGASGSASGNTSSTGANTTWALQQIEVYSIPPNPVFAPLRQYLRR